MADNNKVHPKHNEVLKKWFDEESSKSLEERYADYPTQEKFNELGFDFPTTEEQLKAFNEKFKDFPHKLGSHKVDPIKIIKGLK